MRTQKEIEFLEKYIPELAENAVQKAYFDTLASGQSVCVTIDNKLYKVFPDGHRKYIKDVSENIKIDVDKRIFQL